jgi:hypothetical protein
MYRLATHATECNGSQSVSSLKKFGPKVLHHAVTLMYTGLVRDNLFAVELKRTGDAAVQRDASGPVVHLDKALTATINRSNSFFEVAAFTADNASSNRSFCYNLKGKWHTLGSRNEKVKYFSIYVHTHIDIHVYNTYILG